jgi:hypothetical protein
MVSLHGTLHGPFHALDSFSILGIVIGVALLPIAILGTLFLIVRAVVGL